ncbi:hypothetical protein ACIRD9_40505 [Streptomyces violaceus]
MGLRACSHCQPDVQLWCC